MVHRNNILGLTVKYPEPGLVKTRLARDIGDSAACDVYRTMAEKVIAETGSRAMGYDTIVFYSPAGAERNVREWLPGERVVAQRGADIGRIMDNAFGDLFGAGAERAVVAGVDIPGLNGNVVNRAFRELEDADVVIGPATDGGYYLIGLKYRIPDIFSGISWGTEKVFVETLRLIGKRGLTFRTLTMLTDVDTLADLRNVEDLHPGYFRKT